MRRTDMRLPGGTPATRAIVALGRNDLRTVQRDSMLMMVLIGPFIYASFLWLLPGLTAYVARRWAFDLVPYHSAIISAFCVLGPPTLIGAVLALQLLDERDQHTLSALRVTPLPPLALPAYRAAVATVLASVVMIASLAVTGQVPARVLASSVPLAPVAGLLAPIVGLMMSTIGRNKIEGLAVMRVIGLAVFTLPLIPFFFLDSPWQLAFGILPPYWPVRAFWSAMDGGTFWPYVLGGLAYNAAVTAVLLRRQASRVG
jgi:fluoroquinolone transport system permease protein